MIPEVESFGHLMIARRAGGAPLGLVRSDGELVFLAFDISIRRLVELHFLRSVGDTLNSVSRKSAFERAKLAAGISGPSLMRILEVGEEKGLVYYTSNLTDGEFIEDYVARRGPLQPATVFSLVLQMLDELLQKSGHWRVISSIRLDRVVVTTLEDAILQLRLYDYGLSEPEDCENAGARQVTEVCKLMHLMLTGVPASSSDHPDRHPVLSALPMSLRTAMRAALTNPGNCPSSLERMRDDVREAVGALTGINGRNPRKQLGVIAALQPYSHLQTLLLENVPVEDILGNRFEVDGGGDIRRHPFSIPCANAKNGQGVTVHLLPPSRIVDKSHYEAVPLQMWRFNADRHPNILRSLSLWESPDWTFLTEEREPGFALSRLLAERGLLNPPEVAILLRQVQAGQEQAVECGVQRLDLHPSNILLRVGRNGPLASRDHERLMQKRLDAWPPFQLKLRAHLTMRNLYEPPLVDKPEQGELAEEHLADRDYRSRAFIALAACLLTGQRSGGAGGLRLPDAVPPLLADYVLESLKKCSSPGQAPLPGDFLVQFESLMHTTGSGIGSLASRIRGQEIPLEEMESVGSISDFEDEWNAETEEAAAVPSGPPFSNGRKVQCVPAHPRAGPGPGLLAAAAVVMLGLGAWWLFAASDSGAAVQGTSPSPAAFQPDEGSSPAKAGNPEPPHEAPPPMRTELAGKAGGRPVEAHLPSVLREPSPAIAAGETPSTRAQPGAALLSQDLSGGDVPKQDKPPEKAKEKAPVPEEPVPVIRRAILPSPEEIARFKESQAQAPAGSAEVSAAGRQQIPPAAPAAEDR